MITFHRPDFQRVLLAYLAATRVRLHTSKRLAHFTQPPPAVPDAPFELTFSDGTTAHCDFLVGADGLKSVVRTGMLRAAAAELHAEGKHADAEETLRGIAPRWSGTMAYRTTVPADVLRARCPGHRALDAPYVVGRVRSQPRRSAFAHESPGAVPREELCTCAPPRPAPRRALTARMQQVTTYPIARGALVNVGAFTACYEREGTPFDAPWVQDVPRDALRADFAHWEPEVQALFDVRPPDRKSTRLNSSHSGESRMPSSA